MIIFEPMFELQQWKMDKEAWQHLRIMHPLLNFPFEKFPNLSLPGSMWENAVEKKIVIAMEVIYLFCYCQSC